LTTAGWPFAPHEHAIVVGIGDEEARAVGRDGGRPVEAVEIGARRIGVERVLAEHDPRQLLARARDAGPDQHPVVVPVGEHEASLHDRDAGGVVEPQRPARAVEPVSGDEQVGRLAGDEERPFEASGRNGAQNDHDHRESQERTTNV
jgi:hypothetical protein